MRTCSTCGSANGEDSAVCWRCGAALAAPCPSCGEPLPSPNARFCPACGTALAHPGPSDRERKLVTVLFADVTGSTGLGERLDAESLKEVMDAYFSAMREELEAEGGTVEKFIGDAVMAVFGVPTSHDDDATRALRAAVRMGERLAGLNPELERDYQVTLAMRIGVNTGEVVAVTTPRPGQGMVSGDAVNVTARLEQLAASGQVLVGERTARAARGFRLRPVGALELRGKDSPVPAFELIGEEPGDRFRTLHLTAPMVGRDREMSLLRSVYERVAEERRAHLVTIYGDPGVGKSRLVQEFAAWASGADPPATIHRGRCLPYGESAFGPVGHILKTEAGVLDSDPTEDARAKVDACCRRHSLPAPADPAVGLALSLGLAEPSAFGMLEPRQVRAAVDESWKWFFSSLAQEAPAVVVLEDIHWADAALLDLLEELADHVEGPLLFLCPSRPDLPGRRPGWGGGRWNFSSLLLEPLAPPAASELLTYLLAEEHVPGETQSGILERAGGNPFFLEEIVGRLVDEAAERKDPSWSPTEIPDTVQGVLAARMDLLEPQQKRALQSAAVVGRVFWPEPIRRLTGAEPEAFDATLRRLEDRGLIAGRLASAMGGQREYVFKHVLTRDAAYESLPRRDRAAAHATVAAWLEEAAGERRAEFAELLVHHYDAAYRARQHDARADPEETERLRAAALREALAASVAAREKLVLDEAIRLAERAVELAAGAIERAAALEALGSACRYDYQGDRAWSALREAAEVRASLATAAPDGELGRLSVSALEVATRERGMMRVRIDQAEAEPLLAWAAANIESGSEGEIRLLILRSFWPSSIRGADTSSPALEAAREAGERAADLARDLERPDLESAALDGVGAFFIGRGSYGQMEDVLRRRVALTDRLQNPAEVGDTFAVAAWTAHEVGRYAVTRELAKEGFARAFPGAVVSALHCLEWEALADCRLGDWDRFAGTVARIEELLGERRDRPPAFAVDHVAAQAFVHEVRGEGDAADRLLQILRWVGEAEERPSTLIFAWLSLVFARRGAFDEARSSLEDVEPTGAAFWRGSLLAARCDVAIEQAAWDEAGALAGEARRHAAMAGLEALPAHAGHLEGCAAAVAGGNVDAATRLLKEAGATFVRLGARWNAAIVHLALASALADAGRTHDARRWLTAAEPVFAELGFRREAAQAEALRVRLG